MPFDLFRLKPNISKGLDVEMVKPKAAPKNKKARVKTKAIKKRPHNSKRERFGTKAKDREMSEGDIHNVEGDQSQMESNGTLPDAAEMASLFENSQHTDEETATFQNIGEESFFSKQNLISGHPNVAELYKNYMNITAEEFSKMNKNPLHLTIKNTMMERRDTLHEINAFEVRFVYIVKQNVSLRSTVTKQRATNESLTDQLAAKTQECRMLEMKLREERQKFVQDWKLHDMQSLINQTKLNAEEQNFYYSRRYEERLEQNKADFDKKVQEIELDRQKLARENEKLSKLWSNMQQKYAAEREKKAPSIKKALKLPTKSEEAQGEETFSLSFPQKDVDLAGDLAITAKSEEAQGEETFSLSFPQKDVDLAGDLAITAKSEEAQGEETFSLSFPQKDVDLAGDLAITAKSEEAQGEETFSLSFPQKDVDLAGDLAITAKSEEAQGEETFSLSFPQKDVDLAGDLAITAKSVEAQVKETFSLSFPQKDVDLAGDLAITDESDDEDSTIKEESKDDDDDTFVYTQDDSDSGSFTHLYSKQEVLDKAIKEGFVIVNPTPDAATSDALPTLETPEETTTSDSSTTAINKQSQYSKQEVLDKAIKEGFVIVNPTPDAATSDALPTLETLEETTTSDSSTTAINKQSLVSQVLKSEFEKAEDNLKNDESTLSSDHSSSSDNSFELQERKQIASKRLQASESLEAKISPKKILNRNANIKSGSNPKTNQICIDTTSVKSKISANYQNIVPVNQAGRMCEKLCIEQRQKSERQAKEKNQSVTTLFNKSNDLKQKLQQENVNTTTPSKTVENSSVIIPKSIHPEGVIKPSKPVPDPEAGTYQSVGKSRVARPRIRAVGNAHSFANRPSLRRDPSPSSIVEKMGIKRNFGKVVANNDKDSDTETRKPFALPIKRSSLALHNSEDAAKQRKRVKRFSKQKTNYASDADIPEDMRRKHINLKAQGSAEKPQVAQTNSTESDNSQLSSHQIPIQNHNVQANFGNPYFNPYFNQFGYGYPPMPPNQMNSMQPSPGGAHPNGPQQHPMWPYNYPPNYPFGQFPPFGAGGMPTTSNPGGIIPPNVPGPGGGGIVSNESAAAAQAGGYPMWPYGFNPYMQFGNNFPSFPGAPSNLPSSRNPNSDKSADESFMASMDTNLNGFKSSADKPKPGGDSILELNESPASPAPSTPISPAKRSERTNQGGKSFEYTDNDWNSLKDMKPLMETAHELITNLLRHQDLENDSNIFKDADIIRLLDETQDICLAKQVHDKMNTVCIDIAAQTVLPPKNKQHQKKNSSSGTPSDEVPGKMIIILQKISSIKNYVGLPKLVYEYFLTQVLPNRNQNITVSELALDRLGRFYGQLCETFKIAGGTLALISTAMYWRPPIVISLAHGILRVNSNDYSFLKFGQYGLSHKAMLFCLINPQRQLAKGPRMSIKSFIQQSLTLEVPADHSFEDFVRSVITEIKGFESAKKLEESQKVLTMLFIQWGWKEAYKFISEEIRKLTIDWRQPDTQISDGVYSTIIRSIGDLCRDIDEKKPANELEKLRKVFKTLSECISLSDVLKKAIDATRTAIQAQIDSPYKKQSFIPKKINNPARKSNRKRIPKKSQDFL